MVHVEASETEYMRASDLGKVFPVFAQPTWWRLVRSGRLRSATVGRSRVVWRQDVITLLRGGDR